MTGGMLNVNARLTQKAAKPAQMKLAIGGEVRLGVRDDFRNRLVTAA